MIRISALFVCSVLVLYATLYVLITVPMHGTRVYDCGMAEWHPDIPNKVKEECRKLNAEKIKGVRT